MRQSKRIEIYDADTYRTYQFLEENYGQFTGRELVSKICDSGLFKPDEMVCTTSFGADAAVMLKIISDIDNSIPVAFLNTGKHFDDTILYQGYLTSLLKLNIKEYAPDQGSIKLLERNTTPDLYAEWLQSSQANRDACCEVRKHEPLLWALEGKKIWFTGRKQNNDAYRANIPTFELENGLIKVNPIKNFTPKDVINFYKATGIERHPLVAEGYDSIGCQPCTKNGSGRDGRIQRYCGMHRRERTPK